MTHALHDAFRRDLDTLIRAAAVLGTDPDAQERISLGWVMLADQLHHHHTVEDRELWPLVRRSWKRSPDALPRHRSDRTPLAIREYPGGLEHRVRSEGH